MENEKQEIDFNLIRECLVEYAEELGRPHFDMCVAKRVTHAFMNNVDDVLKKPVELIMNQKMNCNVRNRRKELIANFCNRTGALNILSDLSGMQRGELRKIAQGKTSITDGQWANLLNCFDRAEAIYQKKRETELIYLDKKLASNRRFK